MTEDAATKKDWGCLELMGYRKLYGLIYEVEMAGVKMVRIEALQSDGTTRTATYSAGSLYGVTQMSEDEVRKAVAPYRPALPPKQDEPDTARMIREDERDSLYVDIDEALAKRDPGEDDEIPPDRWTRLVALGMEEAERIFSKGDPAGYREQLVDVAARVVAAIEAHDRANEDDDIPFDETPQEEPR